MGSSTQDKHKFDYNKHYFSGKSWHIGNIVMKKLFIHCDICIQIISGVIIVLIGREDAQDRKAGQQKPHTLNNLVMILAFLITVTNIFVASFGGDDI